MVIDETKYFTVAINYLTLRHITQTEYIYIYI